MSRPAIQVEGVSKRYTLGAAAHTTLQETLAAAVRRRNRRAKQTLWALRDLHFEVEQGEVIGVIGLNGAGKSTLLKILSRITEPSEGRSRTRGRVGALLEVGSGFHPELSGRENIFLNGVILGMKRAEVRRRFDEIVAFAGVERFLDTPLKRYSSGMYLRLAFAVAAHVDPDILIVDEVLAVGDLQFRERCLGQMSDFAHDGRTVVFVSHDLGSVNQLCERTLWLERGRVRADGPSSTVIDEYVRTAVPRGASTTIPREATKPVQLLSAAITTPEGVLLDTPRRDEAFTLEVRFLVSERIPGLGVAFILETSHGVRVLDEDWGADTGRELVPDSFPQEYVARMTVPPILAPADYVLIAWVGTQHAAVVKREVLSFRLWPSARDSAEALSRGRLIQPAVEWAVAPVDPPTA